MTTLTTGRSTYAVEPGHWNLPDDQASQLRDYLLRGGFLMVDDFHGTLEWNNFKRNSWRRCFLSGKLRGHR